MTFKLATKIPQSPLASFSGSLRHAMTHLGVGVGGSNKAIPRRDLDESRGR